MSETTLSAVPRTVLRPEDAVRVPRPFRLEDRDRTRASSEDNRSAITTTTTTTPPVLVTSTIGPIDMTSSIQPRGLPERSPLSAEDTIQKAKAAVEEGRKDTQHALAGSEAVSEVVRPKLTIDLGHSTIARIPEPVVDLIKDEVERLSLSHNQIWHIPYRFAECAHLRYLNIRTNVFREFPKAVCAHILFRQRYAYNHRSANFPYSKSWILVETNFEGFPRISGSLPRYEYSPSCIIKSKTFRIASAT